MRHISAFSRIALLVSTTLVATAAAGAETDRVQALEERLRQMQAQFEQTLREQRQQIEALQRELAELKQSSTPLPPDSARVPSVGEASLPSPDVSAATPQTRQPWRLGGGTAYADVSLVGTFTVGTSTARDIEGALQPGGHDPNQRGFTVQGVELNLSGAVDPYFRGNANLLYGLDADGESEFELEEAWLETLHLPGRFQVRAGQFYTPFGRINGQHPHQWGFVDAPLVTARLLGPDGLRNPGVRVSWLLPTPIYSELFISVQNSRGDGAAPFRAGGHIHGDEMADMLPLGFRPAENDRGVSAWNDLLWSARYALSADLTDQQTLLMGISGALGPNASGRSGESLTQLYGLDLYWKWKSPRAHGGFPFVSFQAEAVFRRYELGAFDWAEAEAHGEPFLSDAATGQPAFLDRETITDYGFYTEFLYGFRRGWVAGLRFDYVTGRRGDYERAAWLWNGKPVGRDLLRRQRWRLSPNLTWYPSEYSRLRLQYNFDDRLDVGEDHSVWLQFELSLGAHAAHQF